MGQTCRLILITLCNNLKSKGHYLINFHSNETFAGFLKQCGSLSHIKPALLKPGATISSALVSKMLWSKPAGPNPPGPQAVPGHTQTATTYITSFERSETEQCFILVKYQIVTWVCRSLLTHIYYYIKEIADNMTAISRSVVIICHILMHPVQRCKKKGQGPLV